MILYTIWFILCMLRTVPAAMDQGIVMQKRAEMLRDRLEDEILTGRLRPGTRLEEVTLAERYGVSRTPIREALLQLSASGLIVNRPRRGAIVAEVGPRTLFEMFEVMAELEALCASLAARRATREDLAALRAAHEICQAALNSDDPDHYFRENETFHELIRQIARNQFLLEQASQLHKRLRPYRRLQLRARNRLASSYDEHDAIVAAIAKGDEQAAATAMRDHIAVQGERFTDLIASIEGPPTAAE